MIQAADTSRRPLYIAIGTIVALVIVALTAVLARPASVELDSSSPEGIVQRYTEAVIAGDDPTARESLAADLRQECDQIEAYGRDDTRVTLSGTTEHDDKATVEVTVTQNGGGVFGGEYTSDERFHLERDAGEWYITGTPWQFTICEETGR